MKSAFITGNIVWYFCSDSDNANHFKYNESSELNEVDEVVGELDEVDEVNDFAKAVEVINEVEFYTRTLDEVEADEAAFDVLNKLDEVLDYEVGSEVYKDFEVEVFTDITLGNLYISHELTLSELL